LVVLTEQTPDRPGPQCHRNNDMLFRGFAMRIPKEQQLVPSHAAVQNPTTEKWQAVFVQVKASTRSCERIFADAAEMCKVP
jgi:hypothetical protein